MSKGKFISDKEREVIRVGLHYGIPQKAIAAALQRAESTVCTQAKLMREDGTIDNLPQPFMAEIIRKGLQG